MDCIWNGLPVVCLIFCKKLVLVLGVVIMCDCADCIFQGKLQYGYR